MQAIGKIGLIMPDISDLLEYNLIEGVRSAANANGYNVIVLTGAFNSQQEFQQDE